VAANQKQPVATMLTVFSLSLVHPMQQPSPADLAAAPNATRRVVARSGGGYGSRVFVVDAPSRGTIADVKRMLCLPPHSVCSDASALELVLKGEHSTAANARTHNTVSCFFASGISRYEYQAASCTITLLLVRLL
jgi:hypothetical protein